MFSLCRTENELHSDVVLLESRSVISRIAFSDRDSAIRRSTLVGKRSREILRRGTRERDSISNFAMAMTSEKAERKLRILMKANMDRREARRAIYTRREYHDSKA